MAHSVHEVDIAPADIGMPEIDGLEFVERIKRTAKRQPEIVFTTAYEKNTPCARLSWLRRLSAQTDQNDPPANRA